MAAWAGRSTVAIDGPLLGGLAAQPDSTDRTVSYCRDARHTAPSFGERHGAASRRASSPGEVVDRDALLGQRVAVAHGDRPVLERLVVDRHAPRRADLVLAAVALADRAALVVLGLHQRPRSSAGDLARRPRAGRPCRRAAAPRP